MFVFIFSVDFYTIVLRTRRLRNDRVLASDDNILDSYYTHIILYIGNIYYYIIIVLQTSSQHDYSLREIAAGYVQTVMTDCGAKQFT